MGALSGWLTSIGRLYQLEKDNLGTKNRDACLRVLDAAKTTVSRGRDTVNGTDDWNRQAEATRNTWMSLRSLMGDLSELGRPNIAQIVAYEFYIQPVTGAMGSEPFTRWFDRLDKAIDTARKDVWKGRQ